MTLWSCRDKVNFKIYEVITLTNNYNTHIVHYAQRIQVPFQSCSWVTGTSQQICHVSLCEFLIYLDPSWAPMKIIVRILCNEAHELKDPALGYIFGLTFLDSFQHIISLHSDWKESLHSASCQIWCFWLLTELVHWSYCSTFTCPLINLAIQGMVVEVELTAKYCLYCFERFHLQIIRGTITFLIIYRKLFFPSFPKVFDCQFAVVMVKINKTKTLILAELLGIGLHIYWDTLPHSTKAVP